MRRKTLRLLPRSGPCLASRGEAIRCARSARKAARIRRSNAVRDQTIAALALVDFKAGTKWTRPVSLYRNAAFDPKLERYLIEEKAGELSVRNVANHQEVARLAGPPSPLAIVHSFSNDGRYVAAKFLNEQTWIWDLPSGHVLLRVPGQVGWTNGHAAFSPDSRIVAVTHPQTGISLYRLDEIPPGGELDPERPWRRWDDAPFCHRLVFNPASTHLAMVDVADAARVGGREGIFQVRAIEDGAIAFERRSPVGTARSTGARTENSSRSVPGTITFICMTRLPVRCARCCAATSAHPSRCVLVIRDDGWPRSVSITRFGFGMSRAALS